MSWLRESASRLDRWLLEPYNLDSSSSIDGSLPSYRFEIYFNTFALPYTTPKALGRFDLLFARRPQTMVHSMIKVWLGSLPLRHEQYSNELKSSSHSVQTT